jgi:hypothetical protein
MSEAAKEGRYIYSVVSSGGESDLGDVGIEESRVRLVNHGDIAAVVHSCKAEPYITEDDERAKGWVLEHSYVIDLATERFGTVLPFTFDIIFIGDDEVVRGWLEENYDTLKGELERVSGKAEYTVQVFCDEEKLREKIVAADPELQRLKASIENMPKGTAYLYQKKLDLKIKEGLLEETARLAKELGAKIEEIADEVKIEKKVSSVPDKYKEMMMVATFSCLVRHDGVEALGDLLEVVDREEESSVRFSGPWAPFSFAQLKGTER